MREARLEKLKDSMIYNRLMRRLHGLTKPLGIEVYMVGGCVRDFGGHKGPLDIDLAVKGVSALKLAEKYAQAARGAFVPLDEKQDIARVVFKKEDTIVDLAVLRGSSIEEDLRLRDFTINAMAVDFLALMDGKPTGIIDPTGGLKDLRHRKIRAVYDRCFIDDPLRMLRAFRFACTLSFSITTATLSLIRSNAKLIQKPAIERIRDELFKILEEPECHRYIEEINNHGLLKEIFSLPKAPHMFSRLKLWEKTLPWIRRMREGNLYEHLLSDTSNNLRSLNSILKFAAIIEDMLQDTSIKTSIGYYGRLLHLSRFEVRFLKSLSRTIKAVNNSGFTLGNPLVPEVNYVLYKEGVNGLLQVLYCIFIHSGVKRLHPVRRLCFQKLRKHYYSRIAPIRDDGLLLDGLEIMKYMSVKPGSIISKIQDQLLEAQVSGLVKNKVEAIKYLQENKDNWL